MADDKKPMQVDGSGTRPSDPDGTGEVASRRDADAGGLPNAGESGGGHYPNPHDEKDDERKENSFLGHGGQSEQAYYGKGQLGEKDVGETGNAPSTED